MSAKKWIGPNPIIGTLKYLDKGDIYLHKDVQIMAFNYVKRNCPPKMQGANKFVSLRLPQLQHRNSGVHFIKYEDITPTPFLQVFLKNNKEMTIDLFDKQSHEIWSHLKALFNVEPERYKESEHYNKALIGNDKEQYDCVCKIPGQIRCSSDLRNTFRFGRLEQAWQRDYLTWYSSGFYAIRKRKEQLENA